MNVKFLRRQLKKSQAHRNTDQPEVLSGDKDIFQLKLKNVKRITQKN